MTRTAEYWIKNLDMLPHPEGGYFREVYRSEDRIDKDHLPARYSDHRNIATSIFFLLDKEQVSKFHVLNSDEIWYHHDGSKVKIHVIKPDGQYKEIILGHDFDEGEVLQAVIPHGSWFGAEVINKDSFSLVGCVVAPGFDFTDFKLAERNILLNDFSHLEEIIIKLT